MKFLFLEVYASVAYDLLTLFKFHVSSLVRQRVESMSVGVWMQ